MNMYLINNNILQIIKSTLTQQQNINNSLNTEQQKQHYEPLTQPLTSDIQDTNIISQSFPRQII